MLLKVLVVVIFRYDAKSAGDPWCIAYDAKSESKPPNFIRALTRAWTSTIKPHGVVSTKIAYYQRRDPGV